MLAETPRPPYYFLSFTSKLSDVDIAAYSKLGNEIEELAKLQTGFLGVESVKNSDGFGITISYWDTKDNIKSWKLNAEHLVAQKLGKNKFYDYYHVRIGVVERDYKRVT